jgi:hypothetical protein
MIIKILDEFDDVVVEEFYNKDDFQDYFDEHPELNVDQVIINGRIFFD